MFSLKSKASSFLVFLRFMSVLVVSSFDFAASQSFETISKIHEDVLNHNPRIRPVRNQSDQLVVTVGFELMYIDSFDTVEQKLTSTGYLTVYWQNVFTTWNLADYESRASLIYPATDKIWKPKIAVYNTLKEMKPLSFDNTIIRTYSDGRNLWTPTEKFETSCSVDVTYFPFDTQRCQWVFFILGEDSFLSQTDLQPVIPHVGLICYAQNGEWEMMSTRAWRNEVSSNGDGPVLLHYEITIRRRPSLLVLTVLLPVVTLALINVFVFTVPSESGERLSFAVTLLLAFGVFISSIQRFMPSSTMNLSIVTVKTTCLLVLSIVTVLCCILSLRLFHRDDHKHPVPKSLQTVIVWLELIFCLGPPTRSKDDDVKAEASSGVGKEENVDGAVKKSRRDMKTDPTEMTWRMISRTLDRVLFRFFLLLVLVFNTTVYVLMGLEYVRNGTVTVGISRN